MEFQSRWRAVLERIETAARKAGRSPSQVNLMAVTKQQPAQAMMEAAAHGARLFGENYVQEFEAKLGAVKQVEGARVHLIGHLQSNKARLAAKLFDGVDSVDSIKLGSKLDQACGELGKKMPILFEVNVGGESSKSGVAPVSSEFEEMLRAAAEWKHLELRGLMCIPPFDDDAETSRPYFRMLRTIAEEVRARQLPGVKMEVLSMGMSHDLEVAIEEGSTLVRIGTALFGPRRTH